MKLAILALSLSACTATYGTSGGSTMPPPRSSHQSSHASYTPPPPPSQRGPAGPAYGPGEDQHWFSSDDYLVSSERATNAEIDSHVAKMMEPPSAATKSEARFLVSNGKTLWTATYYRSRVAQPNELAVGMRAFCHYPSTYSNSLRDKQDARNY